MNKSVRIIGILVIIALVSCTAIFLVFNKHSDIKEVNIDTKPTAVTSIPTVTIVPTIPNNASKYTPEFRTRARSAFIASCKLKVGQQYASACECGADYLAAHYTDSQLEKAYIEYHSGNNIPSEIRAAYDACENK
jgi:hypothetical protein